MDASIDTRELGEKTLTQHRRELGEKSSHIMSTVKMSGSKSLRLRWLLQSWLLVVLDLACRVWGGVQGSLHAPQISFHIFEDDANPHQPTALPEQPTARRHHNGLKRKYFMGTKNWKVLVLCVTPRFSLLESPRLATRSRSTTHQHHNLGRERESLLKPGGYQTAIGG